MLAKTHAAAVPGVDVLALETKDVANCDILQIAGL